MKSFSGRAGLGLAALVVALMGCTKDKSACTGVDLNGDGTCETLEADWSATASIVPGESRENIYNLEPQWVETLRKEGYDHAQVWPVTVSGLFIPYDSFSTALDPESTDPELEELRELTGRLLDFRDEPSLYAWLGLPAYNQGETKLPYNVTRPVGQPDHLPMGAGVIGTEWGDALTFSCSACHAGRFLGKTIMGLQNRQPRANKFFAVSQTLLPTLDSGNYNDLTNATEEDEYMLERSSDRSRSIGVQVPVNLGLDTSLAQVALSLALREDTPYADITRDAYRNPRYNGLEDYVSDSKPMPWWTMKYKTKWLADGSITAGNPILTNFLWNEIGRGTDLYELEAWLEVNSRAVDALTVAIFATPPPRWTDFFGADTIDLAAAKRGQAEFQGRCSSCHGTYEKAWDGADAASLAAADLLETTKVIYHAETPIFDVGTDPQRARGMEYFAEALNGLAISEWMKTTVEVQEGYIPPPLEGIFSRYPYLHNGSVATLCELLSPVEERSVSFYQGPSEDAATDYDADCVGYPVGEAIPAAWADIEDGLVDTREEGVSNQGHTFMLGEYNGLPALTPAARSDLIMFLKTL